MTAGIAREANCCSRTIGRKECHIPIKQPHLEPWRSIETGLWKEIDLMGKDSRTSLEVIANVTLCMSARLSAITKQTHSCHRGWIWWWKGDVQGQGPTQDSVSVTWTPHTVHTNTGVCVCVLFEWIRTNLVDTFYNPHNESKPHTRSHSSRELWDHYEIITDKPLNIFLLCFWIVNECQWFLSWTYQDMRQ